MNWSGVLLAKELATYHHRGQVRRFSGRPYIEHPEAVAETVQEARVHWDFPYIEHPQARPKTVRDSLSHRDMMLGLAAADIVAAAWLHDTVEDTRLTLDEIRIIFGANVARMVETLTNSSDPYQAPREREILARLAAADAWTKVIKLADILDNVTGLSVLAPDFARTYLPKKKRQLNVLKGANDPLWDRVHQQTLREMELLGMPARLR